MPLPDRLAAACPGCGLPIVFDAIELIAPILPPNHEVMCASCGTVTTRALLGPRPRMGQDRARNLARRRAHRHVHRS
jgi:transcription initiation factor TFIIIB Brf1 subunit/transcription initiation factor TFIIB